LQNYARKHVIAIDELDFDVKIYDEISYSDVTEKPEDGCYTYGKNSISPLKFSLGLYLEGARWNGTTKYLDESKPK
jgi:dynein heavy chain